MGPMSFLAVTAHPTPTRDLLAAAAVRRGMEVAELAGRDGAAALRGRTGGHYYGGPALASYVAADLGVALLEPTDTWLTELPQEFTGRAVRQSTVAGARRLSGPAFVKPPTDKSFPAAVYADGGALPAAIAPDTPVQIAEVVDWAAEFRLFVLDGAVRTGSQYATYGRLDTAPLAGHHRRDEALDFAGRLLAAHAHTLPGAVVLDIGLLGGDRAGRWGVVEANMAWFSTVYAADPAAALDVVLRAAGPADRLADRDRPFRRARRDRPKGPGGDSTGPLRDAHRPAGVHRPPVGYERA
ncbi:ATP-grasp domain-containing protein [Streptomyces sp. VRA16 Mangrove soil]|uniref:ATP-grasp domain-containing protein n=1 Tax=Streptomyces sp. VRA16 Mangrove soil TaxID=2817434 RepID=UPI001A9F56AC|nr:ATP-grasp domain-containing protein [Streptomyces sp. VRA16 Mangrove soil]MBO1336132.1 ATP-grasp domain-containing protein [Streptomyces sp. VRA16 Mangrove soil]